MKPRFDLDKAQRNFLATQITQFGYGALAALAFSQVLTQQPTYSLAIAGVAVYFFSVYIAVGLKKGTHDFR